MAREWIALTVAASGDERDLLIASLWEYGATGFVEDEERFTAYFPADVWESDAAQKYSRYCSMLREANKGVPESTLARLADQDWNLEWEKTIQPVRITDRILIRPSWDTSVIPPGTIALTIDPKMSFGTGYHETTRLMLRLLERCIAAGDRVLDVGTGTGVLAIAAIKLGASFAVGVDNDQWSYDNALENVAANGTSASVGVRFGSIGSVAERDFDIVMANIHYSVIFEMMEELLEHLFPEGHLLLSGVLRTDEDSLRQLLASSGCSVDEVLYEAEWIGLSAGRARQ